MEFFIEYAGFLAKTVTLVIAILVVLASFAALRSKGRRKSTGQLQVSKLNDFYKGLRERLEQTLLDKDQLKALRKAEGKAEKAGKKTRTSRRPSPGCSCWISTATSRPRPPRACVMKSLRC